MGHIELQEKWASQLYALQRKSFAIRQILQEQHLESKGIKLINMIPKSLKAEFKHHAMFHNMSKYGAKDLPMWHRLDKQGLKTTQDKFTRVELQREAAKKAREKQFRRSIAMGLGSKKPTVRVSSGSSNASFSSESSEQSEKLPPIRSENNRSITITGVPVKSRPYSTYNVQPRKEHTIAYGHPVHKEKSVVDPRFVKLSQSLSDRWVTSSPDCHDPFLLLSESSWEDVQKLEKADTDFIHKKYMPASCTKKKVGCDSKLLFPKAMSLIEKYKHGEDDYDLE